MTARLRQAAHDAHNAGLCVLPAAIDGSKRPAVKWREYTEHRPDNLLWFDEGEPGEWFFDGLGYICGAVSGNLEMLEFEGRAIDLYDEFVDLALELGHEFVERIDLGYTEQTPSGGIHWLYRVDGVDVAGNTKLARRVDDETGEIQVLIETRGEGGWTVAAPSSGRTHPTGKPWQMLRGGVDTIATISAVEWALLIELCRTFDRMPAPVEVAIEPAAKLDGPSPYVYHDERPGDVFNRTTSWQMILEPRGWQRVYTRDSVDYWRRPGKHDGISATTNALGTDRLKVFSSSTIFDTETTYDKLGALAVLEHGGNLQSAVSSLVPDRPQTALADILAPATAGTSPTATTDVSEAPSDPWLPDPIDWPTFWRQDHQSEDWLLEPFLVNGRGHALYAPAKTGKSLLVLESVVALATGVAFLHREAAEPLDVVYLDYEMAESDLYQRLDAMGHDDRIDLDRLHYYLMPSLDPLDAASGGKQVAAIAERHTARLVIVDTTARAIEGDENDADTIRRFYRHTGMLLKRANVALLRVDHAGKDIAKGQRGSSAKNDDVDIVWRLTGTGERFNLACTHQRVGYVPQNVALKRTDDPLSHKVDRQMWPPGVSALAMRLDELGVPSDAGRPAVQAAIKEWNDANPDDRIPSRNGLIAAVIKWRKTDPDLREVMGTVVGDSDSDDDDGQHEAA